MTAYVPGEIARLADDNRRRFVVAQIDNLLLRAVQSEECARRNACPPGRGPAKLAQDLFSVAAEAESLLYGKGGPEAARLCGRPTKEETMKIANWTWSTISPISQKSLRRARRRQRKAWWAFDARRRELAPNGSFVYGESRGLSFEEEQALPEYAAYRAADEALEEARRRRVATIAHGRPYWVTESEAIGQAWACV